MLGQGLFRCRPFVHKIEHGRCFGRWRCTDRFRRSCGFLSENRFVARTRLNRLRPSNNTRSVEAKHLDEGIGDTDEGIGDTFVWAHPEA